MGGVMLTRDDLLRESASTGFQAEALEKVIRLCELLETLRSHPFLKTRFALKGGTALNLFVFDVPRLSVDIDLNYIRSADREAMVADRPAIDEAITAVCGRLGLQVKRVPDEHAGGKWRLTYGSALGRPATLELDMNYMLRTPLWPIQIAHSRPVGSLTARDVPMLDLHELAAGKLAALLARKAARDLFDVSLLRDQALERDRLRLAFVVYGGCNRKDWRQVSIEQVGIDPKDAERQLLPLLRTSEVPARDHLRRWCDAMVSTCRDVLDLVLPLTEDELEFLTRLNDHGEIVPDLLTGDGGIQRIITEHPMLGWKAQNVREHKAAAGRPKREPPPDR
jgi:predicted nucleotidyltransferase component of viral defense system